MIGIIAFLLPFALGLILAILIAGKTNESLKVAFKREQRLLPIAIKYVIYAILAVVALSFVLAALFADVTDTLNGNSSRQQFLSYVRFQALCISVFLLPAMTMALLLGRKGE